MESTLTRVVLPSSAPVAAGARPSGRVRPLPVGSAALQRYGAEGVAVPTAGRPLLLAPAAMPRLDGTALRTTSGTAFLPTAGLQHTAPLTNDVKGPRSRGAPV